MTAFHQCLKTLSSFNRLLVGSPGCDGMELPKHILTKLKETVNKGIRNVVFEVSDELYKKLNRSDRVLLVVMLNDILGDLKQLH